MQKILFGLFAMFLVLGLSGFVVADPTPKDSMTAIDIVQGDAIDVIDFGPLSDPKAATLIDLSPGDMSPIDDGPKDGMSGIGFSPDMVTVID